MGKLYKDKKNIRLQGYDYSSTGYYFVTLITQNRIPFFGKVKDNLMINSSIGDIVNKFWIRIPEKFTNIELDIFQIMPEHLHGIIIINQDIQADNKVDSFVKNNPMVNSAVSLGKVIRWFKGVTKYEIGKFNSSFCWQNRFYDHIIRNETALMGIREYIENNPLAKCILDEDEKIWKIK